MQTYGGNVRYATPGLCIGLTALSYSFGNQKTSTQMTLTDDHKVSAGPWAGATWSYDAENQVLTANGVKLYLQRETDWEASPRTHTIVYAGYGGNNKTYWGKKSK